jgi:DNA-binding NarL/FixJ family response regulator
VTDQPTPLRIVVADDQASVREGFVLMLGLLPDIEVVGSAADGRQAIDVVAQHHPDAILLDLHMPVIDGIEATRQLTALHPAVAVVVLTTFADDTSIIAALSAGARSYLTKDADRVEIASALRSAASGLSVLDPTARAALLAAATHSAPSYGTPPVLPEVLPGGLTRREAEILAMMARGMTNPGIAAELYVSSHTVKSHINRIFAKTGAADRAAAVRYALDHHLA